ncbi:MAG: LPS assembly lipoprotein LptE [Woeseiaceae bacterium]|nr:LPS assembly lipoprotein LptE [Woeseiaceae bacterium]
MKELQRHRDGAKSSQVSRAGLVSLAAVIVMLSGCGFALQGAYSLPPAMSTTYIDTNDRYSALYRALDDALTGSGVVVADSASADAATLTILAEQTGQRVLSVSARNVPTEYEVFYTVEYSLSSDQESLLAPRTLTLTRDYTYDENRVLGKAAEEQLLRESIVEDLVRIIIKQIDAI